MAAHMHVHHHLVMHVQMQICILNLTELHLDLIKYHEVASNKQPASTNPRTTLKA